MFIDILYIQFIDFFLFAGIFFVLPCIESYQKVDLRTITLGVPPQEVRCCILYNILLVTTVHSVLIDSVIVYLIDLYTSLLYVLQFCAQKQSIYTQIYRTIQIRCCHILKKYFVPACAAHRTIPTIGTLILRRNLINRQLTDLPPSNSFSDYFVAQILPPSHISRIFTQCLC